MTQHWTNVQFGAQNTDSAIAVVDGIIAGNSPVMQQVKQHIALVGASVAPVLVQGETGTGKELVAEALHAVSGRTGELVAVNCAAIPAELLESELFGHEKGAFTGAEGRKIGRFEQACGGTLFLDEIGDMPPALQVKLLRVLETRKIRRLGSMQEIDVDFRLVTATHRDLTSQEEVQFREDLYFRVAVFQIGLPSLAKRVTDIPLILDRMIKGYKANDVTFDEPLFDETGMRALQSHTWRGNIRELRNTLIRASVMFPGQVVTGDMVKHFLLNAGMPYIDGCAPQSDAVMPETHDLPSPDQFRYLNDAEGQDLDLRVYLRDIEVALIETALEKTSYCVSRAATQLRLRRTTLIEKMKKYGLNREVA